VAIPDLPTQKEVSAVSKGGLSYHIIGTVQQTLVVDLVPEKHVYCDSGGMSWMTSTVDMNTGAGGQGGLAALGGMFKRMISGASAFLIDFSSTSKGQVAFTTDFPGRIVPVELDAGQSVILHKHAFLAAEKTATLDIFFNKKLGAGLFGGEGFILQKLTGPGMVFAELDGDAIEYNLKPGEKMKIEPGHIAMFEETVSFDTEMISGITNMLFGGEGLFLGTLTGPGRIWLHSMTESKVAARLISHLPIKRE